MTTNFNTWKFPAFPASDPTWGAYSTARTLPDRLAEVVNVRDFGAVGDYFLPGGAVNPSATDDGPAILAAIAYAKTIKIGLGYGTTLYFPPGAYWIDPSHCPVDIHMYPTGAAILLEGAGRNATWIISNYTANGNGWYYDAGPSYPWSGSSKPMILGDGGTTHRVSGITFWNQSTSYEAACLVLYGGGLQICECCRFIGSRGLVVEEDQFGWSVFGCDFYPVWPWNGPYVDRGRTFGLLWNMGIVMCCRFFGFAYGIGLSSSIVWQDAPPQGYQHNPIGVAQSEQISNCYFSDCYFGIMGKSSVSSYHDGNCPFLDTVILSNYFERCSYPIWFNGSGSCFSNVVYGSGAGSVIWNNAGNTLFAANYLNNCSMDLTQVYLNVAIWCSPASNGWGVKTDHNVDLGGPNSWPTFLQCDAPGIPVAYSNWYCMRDMPYDDSVVVDANVTVGFGGVLGRYLNVSTSTLSPAGTYILYFDSPIPSDIQAGMHVIGTYLSVIFSYVASINPARTQVTLDRPLFRDVYPGAQVFFCFGGGANKYKIRAAGSTVIRIG
jgi:hypothetical protein